jgi:hypothetical protein
MAVVWLAARAGVNSAASRPPPPCPKGRDRALRKHQGLAAIIAAGAASPPAPVPWKTMEPVAQNRRELDDLRRLVRGTNIFSETLLATDYLNHFNEIVMLFELCGDMPELIEEVRIWQPRSYQEHFRASGLSYGELAANVYAAAPALYRQPFDAAIEMLTLVVRRSIEQLVARHDAGDLEGVRRGIEGVSPVLKRLVEIAGAIINGDALALKQSQITAAMSYCEAASGRGPAAPGVA